ncbi:MAG TPA: 2-polyprenylphenol 6-hydroxylase [Stellaceae bacterium]|nr:2-polyprenylphenol 6-hydroxylase [Stellaceae bacterium]
MIAAFRAGRHLIRLLSIAAILARYDAMFPLARVNGARPLVWWFHLWRRRGAALRGLRPGQRLALAFQAMGPAFIKLGQALSTRADLIGEQMADDLAQLQDRLPPFPSEAARRAIEGELGKPIAELFAAFSDEPVAAASIAQVHFARTIEGEAVAVKVLRPGIAAAMARDLDLFNWLAHLAERWQPSLRRLKPVAVVETMAETVRVEMDLRLEASAAAELRDNFADDETFRVPRVDWARTGRGVLTLERVGGIRVDDKAALLAAGFDLRELLSRAAASFFRQVFRDGFFHADLHPGNLFIDRDGALVAVDFGIMGRLDRATRFYLADMLVAFLNRNYRRVAEVHFEAGYVPRDQSLEAFAQAARAVGEPIFGRPLADISIGRLLAQLFQVTEQFEMETQPQLLLLQKTMVLVEGMGRQLDPSTNMWLLARPLVEDWMRANRGPEARLRDMIAQSAEMLERLPVTLRRIEDVLTTIDEEGGLPLHPDALEALAKRGAIEILGLPLWIIALALAAIAIALW